MSGYNYYEFCKLSAPISAEARKEMYSLSSRANVTTHGAFYVYNYGDFRGKTEELVLKYFDVFFYISNYGIFKLIFKYDSKDVDYQELQEYCIKHVVTCKQYDQNILLEVHISNEEGFGWTEGEGILPDLLPLYDEIKNKNYQFLRLASAVHDELTGSCPGSVSETLLTINQLSSAQEIFLENVGVEYKEI